MDVRRRNNVIETGRDDTPVLFDHVGLGGSERTARSPQRRYATLDGYADDVLGLCAELDLRDVAPAGNREPGRFAKLVLLTPSPCHVDDGDYRGGFSAADMITLDAVAAFAGAR